MKIEVREGMCQGAHGAALVPNIFKRDEGGFDPAGEAVALLGARPCPEDWYLLV